MSEVLKTLIKVLELEARKGYSNTASVGGFENFSNFLNQISVIKAIPQNNRQQLIRVFNTYAAQSTDERKSTIEKLKDWLNSGLDEDIIFFLEPSYKPQDAAENTNARKILQPSSQDPALYTNIQTMWGIGKKNSKIFQKLGIYSVYDLLRYFPRRYQDFSKIKPINDLVYGEEITVIGTISQDLRTRKSRSGKLNITESAISDSSGSLRITWFNQQYLSNQLSAGMSIVVSGNIDEYQGRLVMNSPEWELLDSKQLHTNRIVPIYSLTSGITQRQIRKIIHHNLDFWSDRVHEYFPDRIISGNSMPTIQSALRQIHFPDSIETLDAIRKRFAFEEIFFLQLGVLLQKSDWVKKEADVFRLSDDELQKTINSLPYKLTNAQLKTVDHIQQDLSSGQPMNRLLQGDVGSGKTVVARFAVEAIIKNGAQVAIMAPTSILAEQHYQTFSEMLVNNGILDENEIALLVGSTSKGERKVIFDRVASGKIKVIVGTHTLIEEPVQFDNLALAVIDEQHRFGVQQRSILRMKGTSPHLLIMTATPIPRSLALTIYGDLDVSVIDEMPEGRKIIETVLLHPDERKHAYKLIRDQILNGFQAFIIYPLVESEDDEEYKAAVNEYHRITKDVFPDFNIGLMHGRLKSQEKDGIMEAFRSGEYDILVSTTVIEVGVDIPGATVVLIEGANRFGLAQLHQIRGRVGRNKEESFCLLIPDSEEALENERLQAMISTNDGFILADLDLKQRGPGEFLGTRQSGFVGFRFASLTDLNLIEKCRKEAIKTFNMDPDLLKKEHRLLKQELLFYWPELK